MLELLIIGFVVWTIYRRSKRVRQRNGNVTGGGTPPNVTTASAAAGTPQRAAGMPQRAAGTGRPPAAAGTGRPPADRGGARAAAKQKTAQDAIREAREDGNATTAYLMEKAQEDAREHAKEKYEEQKRLHETRGGLPVAERYLLGDPIPQGKRLVNCGYCGAENLIPIMPRSRYSCYFCRETL